MPNAVVSEEIILRARRKALQITIHDCEEEIIKYSGLAKRAYEELEKVDEELQEKGYEKKPRYGII